MSQPDTPLLDNDDGASARGSNAPEFSVSELARSVRRTVEDNFGYVRVRGEIGSFRGRHSSGHAYFSLKDADASIDAVVWRGAWSKLGVKPEEGMEVIASGRMTTFPKKSNYQIVVEQLEPAGLGALMKLLEERRQKLAAEGLFDEARKRPLPSLPPVIGVVTSPTGAVIRDILHRVADRFPSRVVVWPVRVQGETSGAEVAAAVEGFATYGGPRPDVIIVARGGGSIEDLWGFNDEVLVRAVAASPIPVISAVGHETDWTLIDHVADHRAPTPTGAAERAVPVRAECLATLGDRARRLDIALAGLVERRRSALRLMARALPAGGAVLEAPRQRLDMVSDRLAGALVRSAAIARQRYTATAARLSPQTARYPVARAGERLAATSGRLSRAVGAQLTAARGDAVRLAGRHAPALVARRVRDEQAALSRLLVRRDRAMETGVAAARGRWNAAQKLLSAVSYAAVLKRGFALVRRGDNAPVRAAADVATGEALELEFADGRVNVVEAGGRPQLAKSAPKPVRRSRKVDDAQGTLL
ncbi:exodeoxyribonuclease VII large subunit [Acuticoccus sp. MNP-M23]|uniref:exodeoxyribonuclease VII large subunit n=1 Tax=Acuticoccus sp. MNP-M23 TaxID=3072793 RepID=UPI002815C3A7|nr:exodeoxyribonuclease VII large subunit [Acuticoccus sp. MNP-M23]WMS44746.1 exodeoxyribonuclease VII large subunit [Acuticoccus sp. MNP-M23]